MTLAVKIHYKKIILFSKICYGPYNKKYQLNLTAIKILNSLIAIQVSNHIFPIDNRIKFYLDTTQKKNILSLGQSSIFRLKTLPQRKNYSKKTVESISSLQSQCFIGGFYNIQFSTINMNTVVDKYKLLDWVKYTGISQEFYDFYYKLPVSKDLIIKRMNEAVIQGLCSKVNGENKKAAKTGPTTAIPKDFCWRIGQYKLYIWVCSLYMFVHKISAHNMTQNDFKFFNKIFLQKSTIILRYQLLCAFPSKSSLKKQWDQIQIDYLKDIVNKKNNQDQQISWKQVSFELYLNSDKQYFRTNAKCREMWNNHLRPNLIKNKWTIAEDFLLFNVLEDENRCWARIAKYFQGTRNQHMIKNRYKKLMNASRYKKQQLSRKQKQRNIAKHLFFKLTKEKTQLSQRAFQSKSQFATNIKKKQQQSQLSQNHKILHQTAVTEEQLIINKSDNYFMPISDHNCLFYYNLQVGEIQFEGVLSESSRKLFDQGLEEMLHEGHVQFIEESLYESQKFDFEQQL